MGEQPDRSARPALVRFLFDTHVVRWQLGDTVAMRKLTVEDDLTERVTGAGIRVSGLSPEHGLALAGLPPHHGDPFERLLVAQARAEGSTLVTADAHMRADGVPVLDPLA